MVIPRFYTHDDEESPRSKAPGQGHVSVNGLPSPAPHLSVLEGVANREARPTAEWRETEIITNLFLGDLQDASGFNGMIISVLPDAMAAEPERTIRIPFLANGRATLDTTSALIDAGLRLGMRVLVHCEEGCERAPLVLAWFLKTRRGMTFDEAYALIKSRRPIVKDRRAWLGIYSR
jgi:hypothetical protein